MALIVETSATRIVAAVACSQIERALPSIYRRTATWMLHRIDCYSQVGKFFPVLECYGTSSSRACRKAIKQRERARACPPHA